MSWLQQLRYRVGALVSRRRLDREMAEELSQHLELRAERYLASGLSPADARDAARRDFGGIEQVKERCRDQRGWPWLDHVKRDLRYGLILLRKDLGFTLSAVAILALGLGVTTGVFSLAHALLFEAPALFQPERLAQLYAHRRENPAEFSGFSYPAFAALRDSGELFSGLAAQQPAIVGLAAPGHAGQAERTFGFFVSSGYFAVLGVQPVLGRVFLPPEETPGTNPPVAVVSYNYWRKTGLSPSLLGASLTVDGQPVQVVGIMPEHFTGTSQILSPDVWLPLGFYDATLPAARRAAESLANPAQRSLILFGRYRQGLDSAAAAAPLAGLARNLEHLYPDAQRGLTFSAGPIPRIVVSPARVNTSGLAAVLGLLFAMAAVVLLVACLNLANLLLARGQVRRKEIAIRIALGGTRGRIVAQLLTEGLLLALLAGALGLVLAVWSTNLLIASLGARLPFSLALSVTPKAGILAAGLLLSVAATVTFALKPALALARLDVVSDLKDGAMEQTAGRRPGGFLSVRALVIGQVALSLALLTAAGLFVRSAGKAAAVDIGLRAAPLMLVEIDTGLTNLDAAASTEQVRSLHRRLSSLPGVASCSYAATIPFDGYTLSGNVTALDASATDGSAPAQTGEPAWAWTRFCPVGADYFRTLGLPLLQGRAFRETETADPNGPRVAVVDRVLARKLWPDGNAVGHHLRIPSRFHLGVPGDARTDDYEVIGVAPVVRWKLGGTQIGSMVYLPFARSRESRAVFYLRFSRDVAGREMELTETLRRVVRETCPHLPLIAVKSFAQHLDSDVELWAARAGALLFSIFGGLGCFLAVLGVYGVNAYAVSQRTREIGIRIALGARPAAVHRALLREGAATVGWGIALGLLLSLTAARLLSKFLFGVDPLDPLAFTAAALLLGSTVLLACWLPARRAVKVDPMIALRCG